MIPVRKKGSVGPHLPKVARGLESSMSTYDSPRFRHPLLHSGQALLESTSEESTIEEESTDDDSDDDEDEESLEDATDNRPSGY